MPLLLISWRMPWQPCLTSRATPRFIPREGAGRRRRVCAKGAAHDTHANTKRNARLPPQATCMHAPYGLLCVLVLHAALIHHRRGATRRLCRACPPCTINSSRSPLQVTFVLVITWPCSHSPWHHSSATRRLCRAFQRRLNGAVV